MQEKQITYTTSNSYSTLNALGPRTKNVWVVFHGIGYLSRYFMKYFKDLDADENYIIALQAPSKYYLNGEYKHVGASWLTKEDTATALKNVLTYTQQVFETEQIPEDVNLIVLGYSQGVSIACRWIVHNKIKCDKLVIFAGSIPHEITKDDMAFLNENNTKVHSIVGDKDEWLTASRLKTEKEKGDLLFGDRISYTIFDGKHELKKELLQTVL
ncbi:alpha/beta hydrolase [Spongiivirga citrea]|uniref:Esterase n=1 Tax=Spongiivirga citrea TaxID=1481457 RepID=A0A6M0CF64_9FLAO|nr:esterase [Spongiivirga citrea]NER16466.1 esterase [Spongiivirga citrea]